MKFKKKSNELIKYILNIRKKKKKRKINNHNKINLNQSSLVNEKRKNFRNNTWLLKFTFKFIIPFKNLKIFPIILTFERLYI